MNSRTHLAAAALVASCTFVLGCASTTQRSVASPTDAAIAPLLTEPLDLTAAASRALIVNPRVRAAAARLDAASARSTAAALPPDPSLALSFGIPIDGMPGTGISASIMTSLTWLFARDAIVASAQLERDAAARALVAASAEVAAEARRLLRTADAGQRARVAAQEAADAAHEALTIEYAQLQAGEVAREAVFMREAEDLEATAMLAEVESEAHEATIALLSLLALEALPTQLIVNDESFGTPHTDTLEVLMARREVARARAAFAQIGGVLGDDAEIGGGFMQDLEDRQAIETALTLRLPFFRRSHEIDAARADMNAASADLEEVERVTAIEIEIALVRERAARTAAHAARESVLAMERARDATASALAQGESSRAALALIRVRAANTQLDALTRDKELADAIATVEKRAVSPSLTQHTTNEHAHLATTGGAR